MASVTLPRGVLVALVAALLLCLGLTAFLAGRASVPAAQGTATAPTTPADDGAAAGPGEPALQPQASQPAALPLPPALDLSTRAQAAPEEGDGSRPAGAPPEGTRVGPGVVPSLAPPPPGEAAKVARYFQEMEAAQAAAQYWTDPQALAGTLVQGLANGDRSGIDQLIGATRGAYERMRGISVPFDCSEHHRRSLALVAEAAALLDGIATGTAGGDLDGVTAFASKARQLEADAKDVDTLAARIKQRYSIA
jgi:hypothetical protein